MPFNQLQSSYQPGPRIYSSLGSLLYETEVQQITIVNTKRIKNFLFLLKEKRIKIFYFL